MLLPSILVFVALADLGTQAAAIRQANPCSTTVMWSVQSNNAEADVISADLFVGLSLPVKATMLMLAMLDPDFIYGPPTAPTDSECTLQTIWRGLVLYGFPEFCRVAFHLPFDVNAFKKPFDGQVFGIAPLSLETAFHVLPKVPGATLKWSHGYNTQDIGSDIQSLFNRITPLPLQRHPISEIYAHDPADFEAILDSCGKSPVFLITRDAVHIVRSKVASGWQGYDIKDTKKLLTWPSDQLQDENLNAWLLYNAKHESLPAEAVDYCPDAKTFYVDA